MRTYCVDTVQMRYYTMNVNKLFKIQNIPLLVQSLLSSVSLVLDGLRYINMHFFGFLREDAELVRSSLVASSIETSVPPYDLHFILVAFLINNSLEWRSVFVGANSMSIHL
jgi:hypothetical protein